jgi:branched-chain amino acid transport system permease protein
MGFHMSAHAIMMVILGGMGNFAGAIVGAFAFEYLLHVFKDLPTVGNGQPGQALAAVDGAFHRVVVIFAPRGLLGIGRKTHETQGGRLMNNRPGRE